VNVDVGYRDPDRPEYEDDPHQPTAADLSRDQLDRPVPPVDRGGARDGRRNKAGALAADYRCMSPRDVVAAKVAVLIVVAVATIWLVGGYVDSQNAAHNQTIEQLDQP
jgi:hypothetical protein